MITLTLIITIGLKTERLEIPGLLEHQWCIDQAERMKQKVYRDNRYASVSVTATCKEN